MESLAVVTALLYLVLVIRENIWCWLFAAISTAIYVYLFLVAKLYMESVLNVFYFVIAIYGWYAWYFGRTIARTSYRHRNQHERWPARRIAISDRG